MERRKRYLEIGLTVLLVLFVFAVFFQFSWKNHKRIVEQNATYVQDSTLQVAKRIDDVFSEARDSVVIMAHLYGDSLESDAVDEGELQEMLDNSAFDSVGYVNREGVKLSAGGEVSVVRDMDSYTEGMNGNSSYYVLMDPAVTDETQIVFYAPLYCGDEIIGVLTGSFYEEKIREIIATEFFGVEAKNYLCKDDGSVIVYSGVDSAPENILESFPDSMKITDEQYEAIRQAFADHGSCAYEYDGTQGTGLAYLIGITDCDIMLLQTFPSAVTNSMIDAANMVGTGLEIFLVIGFAIYIALLLFARWKQKRALVQEKQKMSQIISGITHLFDRFIVVDFEKNTYEYLKGAQDELPPEGSYQEMMSYFAPLYIREDDGVNMIGVLTKEYMQSHLDKNTPYLKYEYRIQRDGQEWENMSVLCLKRENKLPTQVLLAIQNVTAFKEEELRSRIALKEAFEAADEANRAKSDFLSRMSHDIRTPMNAIMGMTAVATMNVDDRERLLDCLNKITLSSRHLLALINDVLDMSKIESGKVSLSLEEFQMSQTVESLLAIIHPQVEAKNQNLKVSVNSITHEGVIGDPLRLQQVFVNIMGNSVKFTPEGGTISLGIYEKPSQVPGSGCYEFVFEDNGIGMEPGFIEHIFEPFTRAGNASSRKIEGTGLGMPIARNIVRMMNGDIQVESRLGAGSKFTVTVYLKLQEASEECEEELKELNVLVADDDEDACKNTCEILRSIGMNADGVLSGDAAIEKLHEANARADGYAVVILDWKMPGKCGVETTKEIRSKLGSDVPIIILSAYDWSVIEQEAKEAGVNAFIAKPLFKSRLLYVLKSVVGDHKEEKLSDVEQFGQSDYSGRRVLLTEDNDLNIEIAEELLTSIGIEVDMARDGRQAVDALLSKPENYYDLVFMDIQMPVMNGYEAAKTIRASGREDLQTVPIVAMSADAFSDDIQRALSVGMNGHVAKPIELPKLLAALEKWLR